MEKKFKELKKNIYIYIILKWRIPMEKIFRWIKEVN